MKRILILTCLAIALIAQTTAAVAEEAQSISKADWIKEMTSGLPKEVCKPGTFFTDCFGQTSAECETNIATEVSACATKLSGQMPETFTTVAESEKLGGLLGECAGEAFTTKHMDKVVDSDKCKAHTAAANESDDE